MQANPGNPTVFSELTNFQTDAGIAIGTGLDLKIFVENDNQGVISNAQGDEIRFRAKQTGGVITNIVTMEPGKIKPGLNSVGSAVETVNIGSTTEKFNEVHASNIYGISEKSTALIVGGSARTGAVDSTGTGTGNSVAVRDSSGNLNAVLFQGTATSARYADLAEKYTTDREYPVGTAMAVGGEAEAKAANVMHHCIGVISAEPAYLMNSDCDGQAIGLKGRVPVRVIGSVTKGQPVYAWEDGVCSTQSATALVGIALESSEDESEKLIECVLKV